MKRLLVFILLISYSLATTGTNISMHFCMGEPSELKWSGKTEKKTCGKCGMEKKEKPNGCCQDEHKWVKIQDDQKASVVSYIFSYSQLDEPIQAIGFDTQLYLTEAADLLPKSHAPPRSCGLAIYKRNCVFRI